MVTKYDKGFKLVLKYVNRVFPEVDRQLGGCVDCSKKAEDEMLGRQALSSINLKRFHAQGGSIYALYPNVDLNNAVKFIVSLQTISDYLDNLCDRAGVCSEESFRQLHLAMKDAVDLDRSVGDYYLYYPYKNDSGYLNRLVEECRLQMSMLPSYKLVKDTIIKYTDLYSELQTYKHLSLDTREARLKSWAEKHLEKYPDISCWEFSAATGSTLGVFALFAAASDPHLTRYEVEDIDSVYFPWVSGLHILLDYYIDLQEDLQSGDLNFTYYYDDLNQCEERLSFFLEQSLERCTNLRYRHFHETIIDGLLAMYLSDPKASKGVNRITSSNLVRRGGLKASFYRSLCWLLRFRGII